MRLRALVIKETLQIVRDPSTILISVILPFLLMFLYGYGVSLDLNHLRIGVVMEDSGPYAESLVSSLMYSEYFDVKVTRDRREIEQDLTKGHIRALVVIPSYFSEFIEKNSTVAPIQVISDGSETNTSNFAQNYIRGAIQNWTNKQNAIQVNSRYWYNEQLESRFFILPGSLAIIMTLIGSLLTALVVSREWERGTMEALISTSVTRGELVLGKVIPYFFLALLSMALCVFIAVFFYGLPLRGSLLMILLVSSVFLFSALGLGLMISTVSRSQILSYQITLVTAFLPAYILSGFLFEISSMPKWTQTVTKILPARYFVQSLQTLFLVGDDFTLLFKNMIPMIVLGTIFYTITFFKTKKTL
ncbi:MAG: ABC transporter permease [Chlamydiae bacterium]|nr:ABC transporter permease [Chlamydiota bacterium]